MENKTREEGYYWVRPTYLKGEWEIWKWRFNEWADRDDHSISCILEIDENRIVRQEVKMVDVSCKDSAKILDLRPYNEL